MEGLILLAVLIALPAVGAALCYLIRKAGVRNAIIAANALIMSAASIRLTYLMINSDGRISISLEHIPFDLGWAIKLLDLLLLVYTAYLGIKLKNILIAVLSALQLIPLVVWEVFGYVEEPATAFVVDYLSLVMILLISVIGSIIMIFAIGYMREHEHHLELKISRQPRFFAIIFIFLGAMNALVAGNNFLWVYFFWEVTTLCSFLLISHDGNEQSIKNASRALLINMLGGVAFLAAIIMIYETKGTLAIDEIISMQSAGGLTGLLPVALSLLCFASFTKSAQFPFQSWLLGAMVAPTPVSALLHSSTMVKAGVYLVARIVPAISGTVLGTVVAVVGGFTFMAGSAIAISQRNGKRVLAYSTVANLGLIICCVGIGTHIALGAAILLIIFHGLSKGLLFLCIGTIEQGIGSRDIEDMQGLMKKMPFTTVITVIGMVSMLLPPFGVLITKWLAIEAAVRLPLVLVLIILGSAFTVVFWAKWIGIILTMSYKTTIKVEKLALSIRGTLAALVLMVLAVSAGITPVFSTFVAPQLVSVSLPDELRLSGNDGGIWLDGDTGFTLGGFASMPFFIIIFMIMLTIPYFLRRVRPESVKPPYVGGELANDDIRGIEFTGPMDKIEHVVVHNYYFSGLFGESSLTPWMNFISGAIILVMFGVVI